MTVKKGGFSMKNRTAQLIFQSAYCAVGLIGFVAGFGLFDDFRNANADCFLYFTHISNDLCIVVMFAELIQTARRSGDSYVTTLPRLKFVSLLGIILTFLVFQLFLANYPTREPQLNWRVGSVCFHLILPLMYIADWFLFCQHGRLRWFDPLCALALPLAYTAFIYIRAAILHFDPGVACLYPYFFFSPEAVGRFGVLLWALLICGGFLFLGYLLLLFDRLLGRRAEELYCAAEFSAAQFCIFYASKWYECPRS